MEFVHGMSVRQMIDERPMAVRDAIHVMLQVLDALASAHEQGVIHQDVKPANILLTPQMHAKVADFRHLAIHQRRHHQHLLLDGHAQLHGAGAMPRRPGRPSRRSLLGRGHPVRDGGRRTGLQGRSVGRGHAIASMYDSLPLLPAAVRGAAPRLQFVLERAMGKQPEDRFSSGHEMAEALRQILGTLTADAQDKISRPSAGMTATFVLPPATPAGQSASLPGVPPFAAPTASSPTAGRCKGARQSMPVPLQMLEQKLAAYVGPIARDMVRSAAARAAGLDASCAELAAAVPEGPERESFRRDVAPLLRARPPAVDDEPSHGSIGSFHEPELERAQRTLTQYVGPIARVLVRRAAREASSIDGLWQALSMHIELPAERAAFLRQRRE